VYKFIIVTDPDTAPGFRLAGVEVMEIPDPGEAAALLPTQLARGDTGNIEMNED